jgi:hypothetical protein
MPRDEVDTSLITTDRRKRKLPSYATNDDNISADKIDIIKRMKNTTGTSNNEPSQLEMRMSSNYGYIDNFIIYLKATVNQSSADKETEKIKAHHLGHPQNTQQITELSDDDENPAPRPKRPNGAGRKNLKRNITVVDSSSDDQVITKGNPAAASKNVKDIDSDSSSDEQVKTSKAKPKKGAKADKIKNQDENPEDELGELELLLNIS